jgi:rubrerythrin
MTPSQDRFATLAVDLRCARCGYGIAPRPEPPHCPMCGGADWEPLRPPQMTRSELAFAA